LPFPSIFEQTIAPLSIVYNSGEASNHPEFSSFFDWINEEESISLHDEPTSHTADRRRYNHALGALLPLITRF
jgi:hypothetical protein